MLNDLEITIFEVILSEHLKRTQEKNVKNGLNSNLKSLQMKNFFSTIVYNFQINTKKTLVT